MIDYLNSMVMRLLLVLLPSLGLKAQVVVVETERSFLYYNEMGDLQAEYNSTSKLLTLYTEGGSRFYPNKELEQNFFYIDLSSQFSSRTEELYRYIDINNGLYQIEKSHFITLEDGSEIEGEQSFYNPDTARLYYFKGNGLFYYDRTTRQSIATSITAKKRVSIAGDSSRRWVYADNNQRIWLYSEADDPNRIKIISDNGQFLRQIVVNALIKNLCLVEGYPF